MSLYYLDEPLPIWILFCILNVNVCHSLSIGFSIKWYQVHITYVCIFIQNASDLWNALENADELVIYGTWDIFLCRVITVTDSGTDEHCYFLLLFVCKNSSCAFSNANIHLNASCWTHFLINKRLTIFCNVSKAIIPLIAECNIKQVISAVANRFFWWILASIKL